jgi:hypothetical protein
VVFYVDRDLLKQFSRIILEGHKEKKEMGFVRDCSSTMLFGGKYKYFFCCLEDEKLNIF